MTLPLLPPRVLELIEIEPGFKPRLPKLHVHCYPKYVHLPFSQSTLSQASCLTFLLEMLPSSSCTELLGTKQGARSLCSNPAETPSLCSTVFQRRALFGLFQLSDLKARAIYPSPVRRKVILKEEYKIIKQISKFDNELFQLDSGGSRC